MDGVRVAFIDTKIIRIWIRDPILTSYKNALSKLATTSVGNTGPYALVGSDIRNRA